MDCRIATIHGASHLSQIVEESFLSRQKTMNAVSSALDARHLIEVRAAQKKGFGIFAKEKVPPGTRIIAEAPLLKAPVNPTTGGADVQYAFNNLSSSMQRTYLELHGFASEDFQKRNNWEKLSDSIAKFLPYIRQIARDVFWLASRFNHSCIPNIYNAYNSTIQKETFHTMRDIQAGEELTVSYILNDCD